MNIAVIRFSSLGDVALTSPVISSILNNNEEVNIWMITNPIFIDLFQKNERLHFINADLYGKHKGVLGLKKLVSEITVQSKIDVVVDLHDVLRTKLMKVFFKLKGIKTITFNKGRKEKQQLIKGDIPFEPLSHITKRYSMAFNTLVENHSLDENFKLYPSKDIQTPLEFNKNTFTVGIAPFAAHKSKEWGIDKVDELINHLSHLNILLFGSKDDKIQLESLENKYAHCKCIAGEYSLNEELKIISKISLMICMDSANMHLSTLTQTPVISIWGPTHHYIGYGPIHDINNIVEIPKETMPCRPCSIYGKINSESQRKCAKKSMDEITVEQVLKKVNDLLKAH